MSTIGNTAALLSPGTKQMIRRMSEVDGLTPEEIGQALGIAEELITVELTPRPQRRSLSRELLARHTEYAADVMGELLSSDVDAVKYRAAEYILDTEAGLKEPKREVDSNASIKQLADLFRQAKVAYDAQRAGTEVIDVQPC